MEFILLLSVSLNLVLLFRYFACRKNKQKTCGTIIMTDTDSMYVELNNENSLKEIYSSEYATFKVNKAR